MWYCKINADGVRKALRLCWLLQCPGRVLGEVRTLLSGFAVKPTGGLVRGQVLLYGCGNGRGRKEGGDAVVLGVGCSSPKYLQGWSLQKTNVCIAIRFFESIDFLGLWSWCRVSCVGWVTVSCWERIEMTSSFGCCVRLMGMTDD
jgi:hypothetical protein